MNTIIICSTILLTFIVLCITIICIVFIKSPELQKRIMWISSDILEIKNELKHVINKVEDTKTDINKIKDIIIEITSDGEHI